MRQAKTAPKTNGKTPASWNGGRDNWTHPLTASPLDVMSLVLVCTAISGFTSVAYEKLTAIGY